MRGIRGHARDTVYVAKALAEGVADSAAAGTTSGLSQLVARILAQLSLSAWLPAAALVLLTAVVTRMARVLSDYQAEVQSATQTRLQPPNPPSLVAWVVRAIEQLGGLTATDLILMFVAVIVLTMLTQAFAFESIRLLEGYWSSWVVVEWWATGCCWYFRQRLRLVRWRERRLIKHAWVAVEVSIRERLASGTQEAGWSSAMVDRLRSEVMGEGIYPTLTLAEDKLVDAYRWREEAPSNLMRRLRNIDKRLDDYPSARNLQPTRLGNVLRHYEEETGRESVESLVDEVYDQLPFSLQVSHDDQRGRLDLYCSMTFVWFFVVGVGVLLMGWGPNAQYTVAFLAVGLGAALITYRAAIASARYYGSLLLLIAAYQPPAPTVRPKRWWRRISWAAGRISL